MFGEMNLFAILTCAILSMVLGFVWYGPLFGKKWMEIVGATEMDKEARKRMQKSAGPLYLVQFVITIFQVHVLNYFIINSSMSAVSIALWICAGFVLPTVAGASMWNNDSAKISWSRFLIQTGYQVILFVMFALILGNWR